MDWQWLKGYPRWAKDKPADPSLNELKENLVTSLRELGHRFIITIDDVDRLEPKEVIEVLRLARSVADFPNVIYLLCYDSRILSHSIQQAAKVESGRAYLEKIVQLTVMVPEPEPFQLRRWFGEELHSIASIKNDDELSRLKSVVDHEGGRQLKSPRSVVRALDSIRFFWPPLREAKADLADLVWLQLIKDGNPRLFRWIEGYCATAAMLSVGTARVEDAERARKLAALNETVEVGHFADYIYRHYFAQQLPGLEVIFPRMVGASSCTNELPKRSAIRRFETEDLRAQTTTVSILHLQGRRMHSRKRTSTRFGLPLRREPTKRKPCFCNGMRRALRAYLVKPTCYSKGLAAELMNC